MSNEIYEPLELFPEIARPAYVEGIHDDYEGFRILLRGEELTSPMLRLLFDPGPLFYRVIEESSWLMPNVPESLIVSMRQGHCFFLVQNSELLRWFTEVSQGIREGVSHYCICMSNQIIDVIAWQPPKVDNLSGHES
jgi:hypothetical protein